MKIPDSGERVRVAQADDRWKLLWQIPAPGRSLHAWMVEVEGGAAVLAMPVGQGISGAGFIWEEKS